MFYYYREADFTNKCRSSLIPNYTQTRGKMMKTFQLWLAACVGVDDIVGNKVNFNM